MNRSRTRHLIAAALLPICAAGCAPRTDTANCEFGSVSRLYLGQGTPRGDISATEWEHFVADVVTAQFPEGFTVLDGRGQWRAADGSIRKEGTRVLEVVHGDDPLARARVRAVAIAFKQHFEQEAVLLSTSPSVQCGDASGA